MHIEYILLNSFRKAKKGFTAGFHVPLIIAFIPAVNTTKISGRCHCYDVGAELCVVVCP